MTSRSASFMRLFLLSRSSIAFSMEAIMFFLRSLVILACMRLRSRLGRSGEERKEGRKEGRAIRERDDACAWTEGNGSRDR